VKYSWRNNADTPTYLKIAALKKVTIAGTSYYYGVGYNNLVAEPVTPCSAAFASHCSEVVETNKRGWANFS